ncbi:MAG: hypothetical protein HUU21_36335 [Polyangiaceae bacterium]|nr:hypothetical protein [Polyangiaceae bacterium]
MADQVQQHDLTPIQSIANPRSYSVFDRAYKHTTDQLSRCRECIDAYLQSHNLAEDDFCFVIVGSVGRYEALEASDIDVIPVLRKEYRDFEQHDEAIRQRIGESLNVKVSRGADLTKFTTIQELTTGESIGGDTDGSAALTKRILILSESAQGGGRFPLDSVRREILNAYAGAERTSGRHVLSLCNDVARYYRTLCIEYKAKIDNRDKDWGTRNIKLRHSRKLWYLSTMLGIASLLQDGATGEDNYRLRILELFELPPYLRLVQAVKNGEVQCIEGTRRILDSFAWFLDFMSRPENRRALADVKHSDRYEALVGNPFPAMKFNSDLMHREMISLLDSLGRPMRTRVLDWFLL